MLAAGCGGDEGAEFFDDPEGVRSGTAGQRAGTGGTRDGDGKAGNAGTTAGRGGESQGTGGRAGRGSGGNGAAGFSGAGTGSGDGGSGGGSGAAGGEGALGGMPGTAGEGGSSAAGSGGSAGSGGAGAAGGTAGAGEGGTSATSGTGGQTAGTAGTGGDPCDACDDENVCTIDRCDEQSGCSHVAASGTATDEERQVIADNEDCDGPPSQQVLSTVTIEDPGTVGTLSVTIDVQVDWVGDMVIELSHGEVTRALVNQPVDGMRNNAGRLNGRYTFRDGAANLPVRSQGQTIMPSTYRPLESFSAFEGLPVAGEWKLRIADYCGTGSEPEGSFREFTVVVGAACSGENDCDGTCSSGTCACD